MLSRFLRNAYGVYSLAMFGLVLLVVFCPLIILAPTLKLRREFGRLGTRAWLAAAGLPFRVSGLEHLPPGPCVAVCNHASYLDGVLLTAALPWRFTFLVQHGAASWPYVGLVLKRMGVRFVNRRSRHEAVTATRDLIARIEAGESIAIFPEGTFRLAPGLLRFHAGAFMVAARTGVPVVPVVLRGSRTLFPQGAKLGRWSRIEIEILPPLAPADGARDAAHQLSDAARAAILPRCGEPDHAHELG